MPCPMPLLQCMRKRLSSGVPCEQDKEAQEREAEAVAYGSNGASSNGASLNGARGPPAHLHNPLSPYRVRVDIPDLLSEQLRKF